MAYTVTLIKNTLVSNDRMTMYNVTADAASGVVVTNLGLVDSAQLGPISMATAAIKLKINLNAASAASNGQVFISSAVSGDNFFLYVYGRS